VKQHTIRMILDSSEYYTSHIGRFRTALKHPYTISVQPKAQHSAHFIPEHYRDTQNASGVLCLGLSNDRSGKAGAIRQPSLSTNQRWGMPCNAMGNTA
jgi:hypothetical protein